MTRSIWILLCLMVFWSDSVAQHRSLELHLGAGVNYYYGPEKEHVPTASIEKSRGSFQVNAALGVRVGGNETRSSHFVGFFGRAGLLTNHQMDLLAEDQNMNLNYRREPSYNKYNEIEFGMLARHYWRLSAGMGSVKFTDTKRKVQSIHYLCSTLGVAIPMRQLGLNLNLTVATGKDFEKVVYQPSASLVVKFD